MTEVSPGLVSGGGRGRTSRGVGGGRSSSSTRQSAPGPLTHRARRLLPKEPGAWGGAALPMPQGPAGKTRVSEAVRRPGEAAFPRVVPARRHRSPGSFPHPAETHGLGLHNAASAAARSSAEIQ